MRCETGSIRFGEDWPGIFIRGDNALHYAFHVRHAADVLRQSASGGDRFVGQQLAKLADLLFSCQVAEGTMPGVPLKDFVVALVERPEEGR